MAKKVLIIDDEQDIRMYLMAALEDNGYETYGVGESKSILDTISAEMPDLIVLDIMMPRRSGVSIYKDLRESDSLKDIPVVLISGMPSAKDFMEDEFRKLIDDDAIPLPDGFVEKPIKLPALIDLVGRLSKKR